MKPNVGLVSCYYDLEKHLFAEGDRKWETEKTGMEVSKEVRFTVQVDERVLSRRRGSSSTSQEVKLSWPMRPQFTFSLDNPEPIRRMLTVRQGKVFRNVLFKNISWARFEIFLPKKSLPSSPRCHKREHSVRDTQSISTTSNSYWLQEGEKGVICNTQVLSHLHSPITSLLWTDLFCLAKQIPMTKKKTGW